MKALSVVSPNGLRIALGQKTPEVRRWSADIGPNEDLLIVENDRFLRREGDEDPEGRAVAIVRVAKVRPFLPEDCAAACASSYEDGWLAWELVAVRAVLSHRPVLAARGIYDVDLPAELAYRAALPSQQPGDREGIRFESQPGAT